MFVVPKALRAGNIGQQRVPVARHPGGGRNGRVARCSWVAPGSQPIYRAA